MVNTPRVYTPADRAFPTPNSDTPYSWLGMDLRAEPMVLTMPAIEKKRYYTVQLIDGYTYIVDYIGSRTTGNDAGSFLIAGPNWKGVAPKGIKKVIRSDTNLTWGVYRTQLFNPADIDNVKKVQAGYKVQTLSAFLGQPAPPAAPANFIKPPTADEEKTSLEFFNTLNFVLQSPVAPSLACRVGVLPSPCGLPAPKGELIPMMRIYGPLQKNPSVLDGTWTPPPVASK